MAFSLVWDSKAAQTYRDLEKRAEKSVENRKKSRKTKASKAEGLFKQVRKCIRLLKNDPRHPSLETHRFKSLTNPYDPKGKVFEAYAQHETPGAYRVFRCYGPRKNQVTIIAISPHP
jgi:phosphatidylinositol kinase/protein kinase (PI-3  family)